MAKQPARKRQKTSRGKKVESVPLGTVKVSTKKNFHDDDQKDEDELRLESLLFGKKYVAKRKGKKEEGRAIVGEMDSEDDEDDDDGEGEDRAGKEMQHLQDSDLFVVDDGPLIVDPPSTIESDSGDGSNPEELSGEGSDDDEDDDDNSASSSDSNPYAHSDSDASDSDSEPSQPPPTQPKSTYQSRLTATTTTTTTTPTTATTHKTSAWSDPADRPAAAAASTSHITIALDKPLTRKLRDAPGETALTPVEYERRLRRQWERINPVPEWAAKATKAKAKSKAKKRKERKGDDHDDEGDEGEEEEDGRKAEEDEETDISHLLSSTAGIVDYHRPGQAGRRRRQVALKPGQISIERLRDANQATQDRDEARLGGGKASSGGVRVVSFHPNERIPMLCVATGGDRRVRLFNIDGHTNPLLQTLHVPTLPITSQSSVMFHPAGTSLLIAGPRPHFYTHDLAAGKTVQHLRGLWGATFALGDGAGTGKKRSRKGSEKAGGGGGGKKSTAQEYLDFSLGVTGDLPSSMPTGLMSRGSGEGGGRGAAEGMELSAFSPYPGDMLAVAGRGGYVHLVDWRSGSGQVVSSLKCSGATVGGVGGGGIKGLWWVPPYAEGGGQNTLGASSIIGGSTSARPHLAVLTGDGEVYVWDVKERRCVKRWKDEGGFRGSGRVLTGYANAGSAENAGSGYLAVGSNTGYVNIYDSSAFSAATPGSAPLPSLYDDDYDPHASTVVGWSGRAPDPKPLKSIGNLTTAISSMSFNHDGQLLAVASKEKKDSLRLIHTPSLTSYANWPTSSTPLGVVTALDFSARSEYMAVGNTRGRVLLYHLRDYGVHAS